MRRTKLHLAKRKTALSRVRIVYESWNTDKHVLTERTTWRVTLAQWDAIVRGEKPRP